MGPPVKPPPKPKSLKFARALFAYASDDPGDLCFSEGDLLYVLDDASDKDWWRARCRGKEGIVPANYLSASRPAANSGGGGGQDASSGGGQGGAAADEGVELNPLHDACR